MSIVVFGGPLPDQISGPKGYTRYVFHAGESIFGEINQLLQSGGLFNEKRHVVLCGFLAITDGFAFIKKHLADWHEAGHHIELREEKLLAAQKKFLNQIGAEIHERKPKPKPKDNQVFAITDSVLDRNPKQAWLAYRAAVHAGKAPEEITGLLWWQIKTLWLVAKLGEQSQQAPYVMQKCRRALENYSPSEVATLARSFVVMYHTARLGEGPALAEACEQWILGIR